MLKLNYHFKLTFCPWNHRNVKLGFQVSNLIWKGTYWGKLTFLALPVSVLKKRIQCFVNCQSKKTCPNFSIGISARLLGNIQVWWMIWMVSAICARIRLWGHFLILALFVCCICWYQMCDLPWNDITKNVMFSTTIWTNYIVDASVLTLLDWSMDR